MSFQTFYARIATLAAIRKKGGEQNLVTVRLQNVLDAMGVHHESEAHTGLNIRHSNDVKTTFDLATAVTGMAVDPDFGPHASLHAIQNKIEELLAKQNLDREDPFNIKKTLDFLPPRPAEDVEFDLVKHLRLYNWFKATFGAGQMAVDLAGKGRSQVFVQLRSHIDRNFSPINWAEHADLVRKLHLIIMSSSHSDGADEAVIEQLDRVHEAVLICYCNCNCKYLILRFLCIKFRKSRQNKLKAYLRIDGYHCAYNTIGTPSN